MYLIVSVASDTVTSKHHLSSNSMNPEIKIEQGTLKGSSKKNFDGEDFYSFEGIPYAKPPIGDLRFKAPVPAEKWSGVLDATKQGGCSLARNCFDINIIQGSEDCLVINVFSKRIPNKNEPNPNLPVMFWIHGGGFVFGSSSTNEYGPEFLLNEDIVLVSFNYRLGLLGFLACNDPKLEVTGNAGMKDMVLALKWVQKNISNFGGNPNNVTIFGESAGGASVQYLFLSPLAKGLFHRAIAQSGSVLCPWAQAKTNCQHIGEVIGMKDADEKTILEVLQKKTAEEVFAIQEKCQDILDSGVLRTFAPVVDASAREPFLPDEPLKLLRSGKFNHVPYMTGFTTGEGMCYDLPLIQTTKFTPHTVPWFLGYKVGTPEYEKTLEKIIKFYYGGKLTDSLEKKYLFLTDAHFLYPIYVSVMNQFHQCKASTYLYRISLEAELNLYKSFLKISVPGVCHADDLGYLFKTTFTPEIKPNSVEDISMRRFVRLWTNFAKYGNPTPQQNKGQKDNDELINVLWEPVTDRNLKFIDIGEKLTAHSNPASESMDFWTELFENSPAGAALIKH